MKVQSSVAVVLLWAASATASFWWFEGRKMLPVGRPEGAARVNAADRPLAPAFPGGLPKGEIIVIDFWNPNCPCSRMAEPTVNDLVAKYGDNVEFRRVVMTEPAGIDQGLERAAGRPGSVQAIADTGDLARRFGVWAAPAAVVVDREGRVAYIGAYNVSRVCQDEKTAFAKKAIEALLDGRRPPQASLPFYGCQVPSGPESR